MDRKRFSLPANQVRAVRKFASRRSFPPGFRVPETPERPSPQHRFGDPYVIPPEALFFNSPTALSRHYSPANKVLYFDQVFIREEILGEGSFGIVTKVVNRKNFRKEYAVKTFKQTNFLRFGINEVKNLEKVGEHPNIVKFFMAWTENRIVNIMFECCIMSLSQLLVLKDEVFGQTQLTEIVYDMSKALRYLHDSNLVHLDVKPANIMITDGSINKLGDFGILIDLNVYNENDQVSSLLSEGDGRYAAPEVLQQKEYTVYCDIYSLGISIVELATNADRSVGNRTWAKIRNGQFPPALYENLDADFASLLERMLSRDYRRRPSAEDLITIPTISKCVLLGRGQHPREIQVVEDISVDEPVNQQQTVKQETVEDLRNGALAPAEGSDNANPPPDVKPNINNNNNGEHEEQQEDEEVMCTPKRNLSSSRASSSWASSSRASSSRASFSRASSSRASSSRASSSRASSSGVTLRGSIRPELATFSLPNNIGGRSPVTTEPSAAPDAKKISRVKLNF